MMYTGAEILAMIFNSVAPLSANSSLGRLRVGVAGDAPEVLETVRPSLGELCGLRVRDPPESESK